MIATTLRHGVTPGTAFCCGDVVLGHSTGGSADDEQPDDQQPRASGADGHGAHRATNRSHAADTWRYELTSEVDNIEVGAGARGPHPHAAHPPLLAALRVSQGEFKACVADEIEAWYLLARLTGHCTAA